jgi:DNA polymerase-1
MKNDNRLFLLDAYALIYRSYYAFIRNQMFNSNGLNTSAIFGFVNTLDEVLRNQQPTHIAVVFDPPTPTFRHEMYEAYKANREETPEDIRKAVPYIKQIIEAYQIPVIEVNGFEADDVIGTLSRKASEQGYEVYMMTPDKDYGQLVNKHVFMYRPKRSGNEAEILGVDEIKAKYGIEDPKQVIDILALWGDTSDNIPGVPGIGEKTAGKLITQFGSVENIIAQTDQLKGKQKENVVNNIDQLKLSKQLVTIRLDAPVDFDPDKLTIEEVDKEKLKTLFIELEFKSFLKKLFPAEPNKSETVNSVQGSLWADNEATIDQTVRKDLQNIHNTKHAYQLADTAGKRKQIIEDIQRIKEFCFDTETTGLTIFTSQIIGLAISYKDHEAWYIPLPGDFDEAKSILNEFSGVFSDPGIAKVGQNLKFDIEMLMGYEITVKGRLFDTMIAHYLLQPELKHNLDYLCEQYLHYQTVHIEELIGPKGKNQLNMRDIPVEQVKEYAGEDADVTWQLKSILEKELKSNGLDKLAADIEMPLIRVLSEMERAGVSLDKENLAEYAEALNSELTTVEKEILELAGETFNIGSPQQLGQILFEKLRIIENAPKTKTKQYSTGEEVLIRIRDKHPIIDKILDYRSLKKLLSTYVEALPKLLNAVTGKLHTSFNQTIAATGRLSSNNPNLQNIPIREERGREIRKSFIPSGPEFSLLSADYSQIELRLMAHMSEDEHMIQAFQNNEDIHTSTAAKIYGISLEEVSREMRSKAKTANFGIIYGISAYGLSQRLNIPRNEANELIEGYFKSFPGVRKYMNNAIIKAKEQGYVTTLLGRKRFLPDINSRNSVVRGVAERNAINAPIQGTAADIIKIAMIRISDYLREKKLKSSMILQVHDELIFEVHKEERDLVNDLVRKEMEGAYPLSVPLIVEAGEGGNWMEAH